MSSYFTQRDIPTTIKFNLKKWSISFHTHLGMDWLLVSSHPCQTIIIPSLSSSSFIPSSFSHLHHPLSCFLSLLHPHLQVHWPLLHDSICPRQLSWLQLHHITPHHIPLYSSSHSFHPYLVNISSIYGQFMVNLWSIYGQIMVVWGGSVL